MSCAPFCEAFCEAKMGEGPGAKTGLVWSAHWPSWVLTPLLLDWEPGAAGMAERPVQTPPWKCRSCDSSPWQVLAPELGRLWLQQAWFWVGCGSFLHFRAFALAFRLVAIALIHSISASFQLNFLILFYRTIFNQFLNSFELACPNPWIFLALLLAWWSWRTVSLTPKAPLVSPTSPTSSFGAFSRKSYL